MEWEEYFGEGDRFREEFEREWSYKRSRYSRLDIMLGDEERDKREAFEEARRIRYSGREVPVYDGDGRKQTYVIDEWGVAVPYDRYMEGQ